MSNTTRGDVCDKWHRYCKCGRRVHIHANDCACGDLTMVGRTRGDGR